MAVGPDYHINFAEVAMYLSFSLVYLAWDYYRHPYALCGWMVPQPSCDYSNF